MAKSILIVDDEKKIRKMVARYLQEKGYKIFEAEDGRQALEVMENKVIDLIILDLMMPRMDGESFIKAARKIFNTYVIVLTAKTGEDSQVYCYSIGADDYVEKPFSCKALVSKVAAVFSRLNQKYYNAETMQIDGLTINGTTRTVSVDGTDCELKPREYELLNYLILNNNISLSREEILDSVWGMDYFGGDRTVDIHISALRKKLGKFGEHIQTVTSHGYRFEVKK